MKRLTLHDGGGKSRKILRRKKEYSTGSSSDSRSWLMGRYQETAIVRSKVLIEEKMEEESKKKR